MKQLTFLLITIFFFSHAWAQGGAQKPCSSPECRQFDFWVGDWNLTYNDTVHAGNLITRDMDGCVIHEHFHDPTNTYIGESWSVYNPQQKVWHQTWVDNQGAYIALTGKFTEGKMTLFTEPAMQPDGKKKQNRMLFYNITQKSFDWDWSETMDEGKTWKNKWRIHYERKGA